jgi:GNAT superfamily N-acetyltransferase
MITDSPQISPVIRPKDYRLCETVPMSPFTISSVSEVSQAELVDLYESVGWAAYTRNPELLAQAVRKSSFVVAACDDRGELIGLARAISDDSTICYVQDILVRPSFQGSGIGRALLERVTEKYGHLRQTVLITDDEPAQRAFYQALGFTEGNDFSPEPVRVFARFR